MAEFKLETKRLILREWRDDDCGPFLAINTDPRVMRFLGPAMTMEDIEKLVARLRELQATLGHCFWALERQEDAQLIGWCGLIRGGKNTPIEDKVEIGWRLGFDHWGQGYAREAASASLDWAFASLSDDRAWAITVTENAASWGLMERLGMVRHTDLDFDHPNLPEGSPLKRHITYSIGRDQWKA
jgi:RimJ/RimL family protein N-acetyltransferase